MRLANLHKGDTVECQVRGKKFLARFEGTGEGLAVGTVKVEPLVRWATWRFLKPKQILRKVDRQERLGVRA